MAERSQSPLQKHLYEVIFGTETPAGKRFDLWLIWMIVLSVLVLMIDSVMWLQQSWQTALDIAEWVFTLAFAAEYCVRIYCSPQRRRYIFSFYGVVDLLSILPSFLELLMPGANFLLIVRLLRVLRIFRILKLVRYLTDANILVRAVVYSRHKIFVFFMSVLVLSVIFGSLMYLVEGPTNGFSSIPKSIYWTIVTITTVGYGDITPQTWLGQVIAAAAMLTGYSILAVPTGIFTAELSQEMQKQRVQLACRGCGKTGHETDAVYCRFCGHGLK
ncbi:ion transporter [Teredinibacter turnerae]|uniref:ion transporter n=1 Tax=Teredinibacter turnerae TaxID=2426 RepID=UPI00036134CD|nr:ion transporter [Teredinibacter turnerae]